MQTTHTHTRVRDSPTIVWCVLYAGCAHVHKSAAAAAAAAASLSFVGRIYFVLLL